MADEYAQFKDAPGADEYAQFKDAPTGNARPKSIGLGLLKGVMKPLDNAAQALETGAAAIGIHGVNQALGSPDMATVKANRARAFDAAPKRPDPIAEVGGNILGTIPAALITKNPWIGGAAQGALLTDKTTPQGVAMDAGAGAVTNWFGGKVIDKAADALAPIIDPAVQRLKAAGVSLTPGMARGGAAMVREDKAMSRPVVGAAISEARQQTAQTFNTATVNEALKPLGVRVPTPIKPGHDAVDWAHTQVGGAYDLVIPHLSVNIDIHDLAKSLVSSAKTLPKDQQTQLISILNNTIKGGDLSGQALKDAQGELRRLAGNYSRDAGAPNRDLGRVLSQADDQLTQAMIAQNPKWAPQLQKVNAAYRGLKIVEDAASRADEGLINTGQLKQSVRRGDRSKDKSATARGNAFMQGFSEDARQVIPAQTPNSGTADRQLAGNLFAHGAGALDAAGFRANQFVTGLQVDANPRVMYFLNRGMKSLKNPFAPTAIAVQGQARE